jgi:hypothetical protein
MASNASRFASTPAPRWVALLSSVLSWSCGGFGSGPEHHSHEASPSEQASGSLVFELQPVRGLDIRTVQYAVTAGLTTTMVNQGTLPVSGAGSILSVGLPLPVGDGYYLSLSALPTSSPGIRCTGISGPFGVRSAVATELELTLICTDVSAGSVGSGIDVETAACPTLVFDLVEAQPSRVIMPGSSRVTALAHDEGGRPVVYQWSVEDPAVARFEDQNIRQTALICQAPANAVLVRATVRNGECEKTAYTRISCVSP